MTTQEKTAATRLKNSLICALGAISLTAFALTQTGCGGCTPGSGAGGGTSVTTGNSRSAATNVSAPTVTTPSSLTSPSNATSLTVAGGCTTGYLVYLEEILASGTAVPQTATCSGSAYSF